MVKKKKKALVGLTDFFLYNSPLRKAWQGVCLIPGRYEKKVAAPVFLILINGDVHKTL